MYVFQFSSGKYLILAFNIIWYVLTLYNWRELRVILWINLAIMKEKNVQKKYIVFYKSLLLFVKGLVLVTLPYSRQMDAL